ncbi:MAG: HAMP domain-containing sensor histidine kinase [Acuticoccus sp.]
MSKVRRLPLSLRARLSLVVVFVLVVSQVATFMLLTAERHRAFLGERAEAAARSVLALAETVDGTAPKARTARIAAERTHQSSFTVGPAPTAATAERLVPASVAEGLAGSRDISLGLTRAAKQAGHEKVAGGNAKDHQTPVLLVSARLADGTWLNGSMRLRPPPPPKFAWPVLTSIAVGAIALVGTVSVAAAWIAGPTVAIAAAAEQLGTGERPQSLPVAGPPELRRIAVAFNLMAERITRLLDERAQILAAIGHDLRSPITAMRLRVATLDDTHVRDRLAASIDEIEALTASALALAQGAATDEPRVDVDIAALLDELVSDFIEAGENVTHSAPDRPLLASVRRGALMRAFRNIIENAVFYGERARVSVQRDEDDIIILVDDDGPGIPESEHASVFKPFTRLERSRNRGTGGAGLGLSIARAAIEGQGGTIGIGTAPGGGTQIAVRLPMSALAT